MNSGKFHHFLSKPEKKCGIELFLTVFSIVNQEEEMS